MILDNALLLKVVLIFLVIMSIIAFAAYGIDKYKAIHAKWRIPESTLITLAFLGGALGAFTGMHIFHHKIRKWKFRILVPLSLILWAGIVAMLLIKFAR